MKNRVSQMRRSYIKAAKRRIKVLLLWDAMQILLAGDLHLKGFYTDKLAIKANFTWLKTLRRHLTFNSRLFFFFFYL